MFIDVILEGFDLEDIEAIPDWHCETEENNGDSHQCPYQREEEHFRDIFHAGNRCS